MTNISHSMKADSNVSSCDKLMKDWSEDDEFGLGHYKLLGSAALYWTSMHISANSAFSHVKMVA